MCENIKYQISIIVVESYKRLSILAIVVKKINLENPKKRH